jgi:hypothetical protein
MGQCDLMIGRCWSTRQKQKKGVKIEAYFDLNPFFLLLVGRAGVEPTTNGLKVRCSTN